MVQAVATFAMEKKVSVLQKIRRFAGIFDSKLMA
jgi:hypothetical protein